MSARDPGASPIKHYFQRKCSIATQDLSINLLPCDFQDERVSPSLIELGRKSSMSSLILPSMLKTDQYSQIVRERNLSNGTVDLDKEVDLIIL